MIVIAEHDAVVLTGPLPDHNLQAGDVGTVVHIHGQNEAYEIEFTTKQSKTIALVTVPAELVQAAGVQTRDVPVFLFRAGLFEYVLMGLAALLLVSAPLADPNSRWFGLLLLIFLPGLWFFWTSNYFFKVTPWFVLKRVFFKEQTIPFTALEQVDVVTGGQPPYAMIFIPTKESKLKPIIVNIKPMRRKDLQRLAVFLPKVAPHIEYNPRFLDMAEGKMPSIFAPNVRKERKRSVVPSPTGHNPLKINR